MTRLLSRSLVGLVAVVAIGACSSDDDSKGGNTGGSSATGTTGGASGLGTGGALPGTGGGVATGTGGALPGTGGALPGTGGAGPVGTSGGAGPVGTSGGAGPVGTSGGAGPVGTSGGAGPVGTSGGTGPVVMTGGTGPVLTTGGTGPVVMTGGTGPVLTTGGTGPVESTGGGGPLTTGGTVDPGTGGTVDPGTGGTVDPGTGGTTGGDTPEGWWTFGSWHGCVWTGVDDKNVGTNIDPQDFLDHTVGDPYCASGSVGPEEEYQGVALLGFNLNQDAAGADCAYDPDAATSEGPPGVELSDAGLAVNIVKQGSNTDFTFRVQIQGPDGATDENDRWCATLSGTQGKMFVPWEDFNTTCWAPEDGTPYNGSSPISAVVFLVPGTNDAEVPFDFCVNGFDTGTSLNDAPDGTAQGVAESGTLGETGIEVERAKVTVDGKSYILQNNAWGDGELVIDYTGNSFTVTRSTGNVTGQGVPAAFPSIFVGGNGFTSNGELDTRATDNLPKQISQIGSAQTTFAWSPNKQGGFNVAYDIWFSSDNPPNGGAEYNDAVSGFVMLWLYDPANFQPVGSDSGQDATFCGTTWDVWAGERGATEGLPSNRPVISYVAQGAKTSLDCNLKEAFTDATSKSYNGYQIQSNWYLTDVFAGFEIWTGGDAVGLKVDHFTVDVQ